MSLAAPITSDCSTSSEAPRAAAQGIFTSSAEPAEADPPSPTATAEAMAVKRLRWIPFSHSSPPFRTGLSAKAGKQEEDLQSLGISLPPRETIFPIFIPAASTPATHADGTFSLNPIILQSRDLMRPAKALILKGLITTESNSSFLMHSSPEPVIATIGMFALVEVRM